MKTSAKTRYSLRSFKRSFIGAALLAAILPTSVIAQETFQLSLSLRADQVPESEQMKHQCYQVAAQGMVVGETLEDTWLTTYNGEKFRWRITELSSGLRCKVLIEGSNKWQWGSGANKTGCQCEGVLEALR